MKQPAVEIKNTKAYYNKNANLWTSHKTNSFHHEVPFLKLLSLWPLKGSIIDIGCAHGIHVPLFLGIGRQLKYFGIDISRSFLKTAKRRYPHLMFAEANISDRATLPKNRFNGFMAAAVLMHIPFSEWPVMFINIERLLIPKSYGYVSLPVTHPNATFIPEDNRHFTLLSEVEQRAYFKSRNWKIIKAGSLDGFTSKQVWRWYIVQIP